VVHGLERKKERDRLKPLLAEQQQQQQKIIKCMFQHNMKWHIFFHGDSCEKFKVGGVVHTVFF
jgi:hypothetical protein